MSEFSFSSFWGQIEGSNFWTSEAGILERIGMLADQVIFGSFNNALKISATAIGATDFTMAGPDDEKTCDYCGMYLGETYRRGMFMPELPAHPWCRHWWDFERIGSPPAEAF